jgi:hypothetical protein
MQQTCKHVATAGFVIMSVCLVLSRGKLFSLVSRAGASCSTMQATPIAGILVVQYAGKEAFTPDVTAAARSCLAVTHSLCQIPL